LLTTLKWIWVFALVLFVADLIADRHAELAEAWANIQVRFVLLSFGFTVVAKLLLAETARAAAVRCGLEIGWSNAARLYNLSQLAKYLPGSIWHYASRAVAYRRLGASYSTIRDALVVESLWVLGAAVVTAIALGASAFIQVSLEVVRPFKHIVLTLMLVGFGVLFVLLVRFRASSWRVILLARPSFPILLIQAAVWLSLGCALKMQVLALGLEASLSHVTALFAGAYAVGVSVPIAPAGLGVRDAILATGLLVSGPAAEVFLVVMLSRVIYMITEITLVVGQELWMLGWWHTRSSSTRP
jgi:hypothetical protein